MISHGICLSPSDWLHLIWWSLVAWFGLLRSINSLWILDLVPGNLAVEPGLNLLSTHLLPFSSLSGLQWALATGRTLTSSIWWDYLKRGRPRKLTEASDHLPPQHLISWEAWGFRDSFLKRDFRGVLSPTVYESARFPTSSPAQCIMKLFIFVHLIHEKWFLQ